MTRKEHTELHDVAVAIRKFRLKLVGTPRPANQLGYSGLAFGITSDGVVAVEDDGMPMIVLTYVYSNN